MRKNLSLLLVVLLLLFIPALSESAENLIENGDFELIDAFSLPESWYRDAYYTDASELSVVEDGGIDGSACVMVVNPAENDARFAQAIEVEPDTLYRLTCMAKAEDCDTSGGGAGISVRDTFATSAYVYDTHGEWTKLELVGKTGENQTSMIVMVRLGGYSAVTTGRAWFDDVTVERLSEAPAGVEVFDFTPFDYSASRSEDSDTEDEEPARNTEAYLLLTCIYVLIVIGFARKKRRPGPNYNPTADRNLFVALMFFAFAVRAVLAVRVRGYNTDINCFEAWSERIFSSGLGGFYGENYFCDYPPGYMIMLWPVALLRRLMGIEYNTGAHLLLLKLIPILADLLGAYIVYKFAKDRLGDRAALLLGAFYALNPAAILDSACWGQIDSVLTLLIVISSIEAVRGKYLISLPVYALAVLVKPQALLFGPLGLTAVVLNILLAGKGVENGRNWKREALSALLGTVAALALMYLVALPFCFGTEEGFSHGITSPVRWLYSLYSGTLGSYPYFSLNTLNLYTLFGLNWSPLTSNPVLEAFGWIMFVAAYAYSVILSLVSRDRHKIYLCGATLMALICTFGPKIHERYVFPALILLALAYAVDRDKRIMISMIALTATLTLNQALVLQGGMTAANYGHLHASEQWLNAPLSAINVLNAALMLWTSFDLCIRKRRIETQLPPEMEAVKGPLPPMDNKLHMVKWDFLIMAAITLAYSVLAFVNLGSTTAPETSWTSAAEGEQIVFDLGGEETFRMIYYGGISDSAFTVALSNDGETWTEPYWAKYGQGEIFRWIYYVPATSDLTPLYEQTVPTSDGSAYTNFASSLNTYPYQTARYVRITAQAQGLILSEIAFLDEDGAPLPVRELTRSGLTEDQMALASDPMRLIDEQSIVPAVPSYLNSTYFDEIYHARTAYEHLHSIVAYEWTHPPLGKVLMMFGVWLFGMTPFGWRFMGTLMGVLMLPVMYLLVKQLTKRTDLSAIATFLLAVDSMHFTQTRIATIDSYAVFFIMVMYLFMFRYTQTGWYRQSFWKSLIPLGLSGLFMGFAIATKWIGLYAAVGPAVLFFWSLTLRMREYPGRSRQFATTAVCFVAAWLLFVLAVGAVGMGAGLASALADAGILSGGLTHLSTGAWMMAALILLLLAGACAMLVIRQMQKRTDYQREFWRNMAITIGFCLIAFVLIPAVIYYFSYYWQLRPEAEGLNLKRVLQLQRQMLNYHAGLGGDTHYFRSPWYQWPIIWWPMWYYSGTSYQAAGVISSISCMGNPAVWWTGLIAIVFVALRLSWKRKGETNDMLIAIGFASQFLPWVLVPRSTFIYHYFASVPFIILATALMLEALGRRAPKKYRVAAIVLCAAALVLFAAFYPLESGAPVARSYANWLRWFKWYNF